MVAKLILVIGSYGQLALSFKKICPKSTKFISQNEINLIDTSKINAILSRYEPKYILNFAAYNKVDDAERNEENILINSTAVKVISEYCCSSDIPLVHISTDYVFDGLRGDYSENDQTNPINAYGKAKLKGENFIQEICSDYAIIRTAWLYSNGENNFLNKIKNQFTSSNSLKGASDIIGNPTSSDSLAQGVLAVLEKRNNKKLKSGIFHFANKGKVTKFEFICEINKLLSNKLNKKEKRVLSVKNIDFNLEAKRPFDTSLNVSKFESEFDFIIPTWDKELSRVIKEI